jgi:hypothetical protein
VTNQVNVVNRGFEYVAQWINIGSTANTTTWPKPGYIGWGTANNSNPTTTLLPAGGPTTTQGTGQWNDVAPFFESAETRTAGTVSVTGNSTGSGTVTAQIIGTITSLSNQNIGESFLAMTATKPVSSSIATGNMTNVQTSFTAAAALGTVVAPYSIQIDNEVLTVSATASSNIYTVTRGVNGSTAAAHNQNAGVTLGNIPGVGASNPNNGDMFAHAGFIQLSLNTGDSIQFTWQVGVTS